MLNAPPLSPKFGWRNHTHHHIDAVAVQRMPDTTPKLEWLNQQQSEAAAVEAIGRPPAWWKRFLQKHLAKIDGANDLKDLVNATPKKHFLDLEHRGNHREPLTAEQRSWEDIQREFSPEMLNYYQKQWKEKPLTPDTISKEAPNVMTAISDSYNEVVAHLKKVVDGLRTFDGSKMDETTQKSLFDRLRLYTADLAHFVADAHVPLHATEYFDWPLAGLSDKTIHNFLEGVVFEDNDPVYAKIATDANRRRKELPRFTQATLPQEVLKVVQNSHKLIFKMVTIQKEVLAQPESAKSVDAYETELARRLKDEIAIPQIKEAQEMLAGILQSAWEEVNEQVQQEIANKPA